MVAAVVLFDMLHRQNKLNTEITGRNETTGGPGAARRGRSTRCTTCQILCDAFCTCLRSLGSPRDMRICCRENVLINPMLV